MKPNEGAKYFGRWFAIRRASMGIDAATAAKAADVPESELRSMEDGFLRLQPAAFQLLLDLYRISEFDLANLNKRMMEIRSTT